MHLVGLPIALLTLLVVLVLLVYGLLNRARTTQMLKAAGLVAIIGLPVGFGALALGPGANQRERQADRAGASETMVDEAPEPTEDTSQSSQSMSEESRQREMVAKVHAMSDEIAVKLRSAYDFEAQPMIGSDTFCREDNFCELNIGEFSVRVSGAGIAEVYSSTEDSFDLYRELCAAVFSAISETDLDFSAATIDGAFVGAAATGRNKFDLNGVQIDIRSDLGDHLTCRFFKYGAR